MKILIIRLSSLGDIILTQPIVRKLQDTFPQAELYFLTKKQYIDVPEYFGIPLKVLTYSKLLRFHSELRKKQFDYVFDLQAKFNSFIIKTFCVRAVCFTYDKQHAFRKAIVSHKTKQGINSTLDLYQSALLKASMILKNINLAEGLYNPGLDIPIAEMDRLKEAFPKPTGKKVTVLFPGATHFTKIYPAERFVKMIQAAPDENQFWLLGSANEADFCQYIKSMTRDKSTDLSGRLSLKEVIGIIAISDAVITNDSGPMHIAAALGKRQVAIFGATHPLLGFRPLNDNATVICKNLSCQPCSLHGGKVCPRKHFACMLSIDPTEIKTQYLNSV